MNFQKNQKNKWNKWFSSLLFLFFFPLILNFCYVKDIINSELVFEEISSHHFDRPIDFILKNKNLAYVAEQKGRIYEINFNKNEQKTLVLNIEDRLSHANEQGLLSMALDPKYNENHFIYVYYTIKNKTAILSRFVLKSYRKISLNSEKIILKIEKPYRNHNGGQLSFGKDGYLYVGVGDGGSAGDPLKAGQNLNTLLGKILRIDVNQKINNKKYSIPKDNPFVNKKAKLEIYAYGFRNPWTFSFDRLTNQMFVADVGQNRKEEINLVVKGGNYGWSIKEADLTYDKKKPLSNNLIDPIASYGHRYGVSVSGGYVYRGKKIKELDGVYLYTDYVSGNFWGLKVNQKGKVVEKMRFKSQDLRISKFAQDDTGEIYICSFKEGKIMKLVGVRN